MSDLIGHVSVTYGFAWIFLSCVCAHLCHKLVCRRDAQTGAGDASTEPGRPVCGGFDPGEWRACSRHGRRGSPAAMPR